MAKNNNDRRCHKKDDWYGGGFIISYPKRKSSAYLDKTDTKPEK